jgi:hypothetical protein
MSFRRVFDKNFLPGETGLRTWLEIFIFIFIFSIHFICGEKKRLYWVRREGGGEFHLKGARYIKGRNLL